MSPDQCRGDLQPSSASDEWTSEQLSVSQALLQGAGIQQLRASSVLTFQVHYSDLYTTVSPFQICSGVNLSRGKEESPMRTTQPTQRLPCEGRRGGSVLPAQWTEFDTQNSHERGQ